MVSHHVKKGVIWRNPDEIDTYISDLFCTKTPIYGDGILAIDSPITEIINIHNGNVYYQPYCYQGNSPVIRSSANIPLIPVYRDLSQEWSELVVTSGTYGYPMSSSLFAVICALTAATVISFILSLTIFASERPRPWLQKLAAMLASISLCTVFGYSVSTVNSQHAYGYQSTDELIDKLRLSLPFNILDFFVILFLQLSQVQIVMRIFPRQKEKRLIFWIGGLLSVASQVIWGISTFTQYQYDIKRNEYPAGLSILPAFIYLLRIAMCVLYAALIGLYGFDKRSFIFQTAYSTILMTCFAVVAINLQLALFICDVADAFIAELSEIFNSCCYVISVVIVWEWINRVQSLERRKQRAGILGRPFYEDEVNITALSGAPVGKQPPRKPLESSSSGSDRHIHFQDPPPQPMRGPMKLHRALNRAAGKFLYATDKLITGLAVPRSVSAMSYEIERVDGLERETDMETGRRVGNDVEMESDIVAKNSDGSSSSVVESEAELEHVVHPTVVANLDSSSVRRAYSSASSVRGNVRGRGSVGSSRVAPGSEAAASEVSRNSSNGELQQFTHPVMTADLTVVPRD